jgi:hypothetical protein
MMLFRMGNSLPANSRGVAAHVDPGEGSPQKAYPPMSKRPWQLEWAALRFLLRFVLYPGSFLRQADAFPLFPGTISISPLSRRL